MRVYISTTPSSGTKSLSYSAVRYLNNTSCSSLVIPKRYNTSLILLEFSLAGACICTFGFAWNATPRPATPIIGRSFAPSPIAMT